VSPDERRAQVDERSPDAETVTAGAGDRSETIGPARPPSSAAAGAELEAAPTQDLPPPLRVAEFDPGSDSRAHLTLPDSSSKAETEELSWRSLLPPPPTAGALGLEGYRISEELGRGAQGVVYRATPDGGGRDVALKVLRPDATDAEIERFQEAVAAMGVLEGVAGVVGVLARGTTSLGSPYYTMELVRGPSLRAVLHKGRLGPQRTVRLLVDVAYALHEAHDRGVVHRDLKPENVLIEVRGGRVVPRIADFGLARDLFQTTASTVHGGGTPAYMAPEQVMGHQITRRTDVHALGAILYEVIAGSPPFRRTSVAATAHAIVHGRPRRPLTFWSGLPEPLADVALRALEKDQNARYPTAAVFATHVKRALGGQAIGHFPTRPVRDPRTAAYGSSFLAALRRRRRFYQGLVFGLLLGLAAGLLVGTVGVQRAVKEGGIRRAE